MARGLNVAVTIGGRIGASFDAAVRGAESRMERLGRNLALTGAKMKAFGAGNALNSIGTATAVGFAASRAARPFIEFEDSLVRLGNTAEVHGARLDAIGKQIVLTGSQFGMGGRAAIVGAQDFVAAGLSLDTAMQAMAPTLKLAKTAGVEVGEASQSGIALMQNMGIEARQLGAAFDVMAKAGKEGRFEIDDMAKAFPSLASRASTLGAASIAANAGMKLAGARALGGSVSGGAPYLVGERGPEYFVPGRSGTIIDAATVSAMNRSRGGGGASVTNHFVINGATDPQATAREVERVISRMAAGQSALLSD